MKRRGSIYELGMIIEDEVSMEKFSEALHEVGFNFKVPPGSIVSNWSYPIERIGDGLRVGYVDPSFDNKGLIIDGRAKVISTDETLDKFLDKYQPSPPSWMNQI